MLKYGPIRFSRCSGSPFSISILLFCPRSGGCPGCLPIEVSRSCPSGFSNSWISCKYCFKSAAFSIIPTRCPAIAKVSKREAFSFCSPITFNTSGIISALIALLPFACKISAVKVFRAGSTWYHFWRITDSLFSNVFSKMSRQSFQPDDSMFPPYFFPSHFAKRASSSSPSRPLFSGWNWVAKRFLKPSAQQKSPP